MLPGSPKKYTLFSKTYSTASFKSWVPQPPHSILRFPLSQACLGPIAGNNVGTPKAMFMYLRPHFCTCSPAHEPDPTKVCGCTIVGPGQSVLVPNEEESFTGMGLLLRVLEDL